MPLFVLRESLVGQEFERLVNLNLQLIQVVLVCLVKRIELQSRGINLLVRVYLLCTGLRLPVLSYNSDLVGVATNRGSTSSLVILTNASPL